MTPSLAPTRTSWRTWHRPLLVCTGLMATLVLVCGAGLAVDDRTLLGEPVWYKPLKFGFAFGLYAATLAWLLAKLNKGRRLAWWLGTVFAVTTVAEVGAVTVQAARGTISHFNADQADPITLALTPVLTLGVMVIVIAQLVLGVVVLIQRTGGPALNRAIRAGTGRAIAGMLIPVYWMVTEINERTVTDANGRSIPMYLGHGIGAPDGNGMPLTHWSVTGGDFRVPHFFALHGIQVLLVLAAILVALSARRAGCATSRYRPASSARPPSDTGLVAVVTCRPDAASP
ncbi:hypothetical protein [Streptomyces sp. NPDC051109]|uniref:hypothetical protein n=1 Tax=Streptomyces sp. NPDC051109 TaxID=3365642 RepID=UPI0037A39086